MNMTARSLGAVVALTILGGCYTPYQRMGFSGGYRDTEVAPGIIRIDVRGNAFTSLDTLEEYFHRRAAEICHPRKYDWRFDSGASRDPSTFVASKGLGGTVTVREQPGYSKGWVRGFVTCAGEAPKVASKQPPPKPKGPAVQVIDVVSWRVANVPEDTVRDQIAKSRRLALVTDGHVEALTPEGHRVRVAVSKVSAARALGYRLLSGAELTEEDKAAALGNE